MAARITERAQMIRNHIFPNGTRVLIWEDCQIGQRVQQSYGSRWWLRLVFKNGGKTNKSTMNAKIAADWLAAIDANAAPFKSAA